MALTEQNNISIAEIVVYIPALFIAIWLSIQHGFGRNVGWLYMILFSLCRIIGASLQLATISQPKNISLYVGAATLQNVGLSPLILVQIGLLGRALESIRKSTTTFLDKRQLRLVQTVILVALILGIVGGSKAGTTYSETGQYVQPGISKVGIGLMIAAYALLVVATAVCGAQIRFAEPGEKRLVLAVALSLPFILVRLVYSAAATIGGVPSFSLSSGNPSIQLGMSVVMEMVVVAVVEAVGLTLKKLPETPPAAPKEQDRYRMGSYQYQRPGTDNGTV